jgi:GR25 family glycosyltransferase involved in LPS biosynthesis
MKYSLFEGIDGKHHTYTDLEKFCLKNVDYNIVTQNGVACCCLSHIKLIEDLVANHFHPFSDDKDCGASFAVICEDDIDFAVDTNNINNIINDIMGKIDVHTTSIVFLGQGIQHKPRTKKICDLNNSHALYNCNYQWCEQGTVAYLITKHGATNILYKYFHGQCNRAIDFFYIDHIQNAYIVYPPLMLQDNNIPSTIEGIGGH